jgi:hypothetical protein
VSFLWTEKDDTEVLRRALGVRPSLGARFARSFDWVLVSLRIPQPFGAFIAGGGVRPFGLPKGDVALGVVWMLAWVKDLGSLEVGTGLRLYNLGHST